MDAGKLEEARENLVLAFTAIDKLGEFFASEHAWLFSSERGRLGERLLQNVDYIGHCVPELYETQIHLAHALRDILVALEE